ncbi:hypothetical protein CHCC20442_3501 [Bacillus licheniformis]|nr:hypothetical protein CHCC20442_3501 [Bacillus licheniformis]
MNEFIQNMTGMGAMTEQVIATDFLLGKNRCQKHCHSYHGNIFSRSARNA